jgi:hypothetical protein
MLKRDLPLRFRTGQWHMEDHLLWLQLAHAGHRIELLHAPLAVLYKAAFGESGISAQLVAMERAELNNFRLLYRQGVIGAPFTATLVAWSLAKFGRRLSIVAARRLTRVISSRRNPR